MKKSLISKFLLGVMSLSMVFSVVGNNTAKAGGLGVLDSLNNLDELYGSHDLDGFEVLNDLLIKLSEKVFKDPDVSGDEVVNIIQDALSMYGSCDTNLIFVVLKKCFERFPNLINVGFFDNHGLCTTALFWAVARDNVEMINWLLDHGAVWVTTTDDRKYVKNDGYLYKYADKRAKETGNRDVLDRLLAQGRRYGCEPMDLAQINPPAVARPMPQPKTGLKARFRKMLGRFGSR